MAKYKNISKHKVILIQKENLITIKPQEIVELPFVPSDSYNQLKEIYNKPTEEEASSTKPKARKPKET